MGLKVMTSGFVVNAPTHTYCATLLCDDFEKGNIYKIYI